MRNLSAPSEARARTEAELNELSRVQDPLGVEGMLDRAVQRAALLRHRLRPPALLGESDAVFTCDHSAPREHLFEQIVERRLASLQRARLHFVEHHIDMNVAVPRVAKAGDGQAMLLLQLFGETEQVFKPTARHGNVLVELCQSGIAKRVGEFAAHPPESLAFPRTKAALNEYWLRGPDDSFQLLQLGTDGLSLAVEFDDEVGPAA